MSPIGRDPDTARPEMDKESNAGGVQDSVEPRAHGRKRHPHHGAGRKSSRYLSGTNARPLFRSLCVAHDTIVAVTRAPAPDPLPGLGLTAILVAGARAAESARRDRLFDDPFAREFVEAARLASPAIAQAVQGSPDESINQARRDAVAVRTRFFDDYLFAAADAGCRQVVLLAAGLDARAFRLQWPERTRLWELDMPAVFQFKERILADHGAEPRCDRRIVPVDLREDWPQSLAGAGFDSHQRTAWLVEGLLMYLEEPERDRLLDRVGRLSSPGSRLALDHSPRFFSPPVVTGADDPSGERAAARFAALAAAAASDPSLAAPEAWLTAHGWRATIDEPAAILARHGRPVPAQLQPAAPGAPRRWIATAERVLS
jgi:methyltransferase (TIGR00027 family)